MSHEARVAVCGLDCNECDIYRSSHGDDDLRRVIASSFSRKLGKEILPEQITCDGCRCPPERNWSSDCAIMKCALERGHIYCSKCSDFICEKLFAFENDGSPTHKKAVDYLRHFRNSSVG
jgi:hypothetical protein